MFILEKPYVSEYLVQTIVQNDWPVLDNSIVEEADIEEDAFILWTEKKAVNYYLTQEFPLIYSNSENSISWILEKFPQSNLSEYIKFFKDKFQFREALTELYPDFYCKAYEYNELQNVKPDSINYPVILKPAVGFLSFGVHSIKNAEDWNSAIKAIGTEMKTAASMYPDKVIDSSKFIVEELIEGDEYAIDAYYDRNGEAYILNIFQHPFLNDKDVRDRIYVTSAEIMIRYMAKFIRLLDDIGKLKNIRNFPLHLELRVTPDGKIIPIEANPMRFAGWCTTDVAEYAWGINVYEYYYNQIKPDWNKIIESSGKDMYYFSMAEVPANMQNGGVKEFNYAKYLANFSNVLEVRRINPAKNPLFAIIFGSTDDKNEIRRILGLKTSDYVQ